MFDVAFRELTDWKYSAVDCGVGLAFLRSTAALYGLDGMSYLGLNIPNRSSGPHFVHLMCSDTALLQNVTSAPLNIERTPKETLSPQLDWLKTFFVDSKATPGLTKVIDGGHSTLIAPKALRSEVAVVGFRFVNERTENNPPDGVLMREWTILANYFHCHMLRINGINADNELIISARELDCLRWTAAGKSAWEASVILGISERTVRFHLNAAREKLNSATTAQAVAKAISQNIISI